MFMAQLLMIAARRQSYLAVKSEYLLQFNEKYSAMFNKYKLLCRHYQTKTGVFGYLPKKKAEYQIPDEFVKARAKYGNFYRLVSAYRLYGHIIADTNPFCKKDLQIISQLQLSFYDLDPGQTVAFKGVINYEGKNEGTVEEAVRFLEKMYCQQISAEFSHLPIEEFEWLSENFEALKNVPVETEKNLMISLVKSQVFDNFLATKFSTLKRYGAEGAESMMAFFWQLLKSCTDAGIQEIVIGMAHRGRLNLLAGMFNLPAELIFRKIKGLSEFRPTAQALGDVLSHLSASTDIGSVHVTLIPNPSHLEAVNPVSMGKTRAKQMMIKEGGYGDGSTDFGSKVLNVQVHGDAAFTGQGINQETITLSGLPHYNVGGVIHVIINNQLGFTTPSDRGRSTRYPTDLAKMISAPVFHVNGDFPDRVAQITELAVRYQNIFRKDIFINLNCYRKWGHNELDDPTLTNPEIYKIIHKKKTVPDTYVDKMVQECLFTREEVEKLKKDYYDQLNNANRNEDFIPEESYFKRQWSGFVQAGQNTTIWDTGFDVNILKKIGIKSVYFPQKFNIHKHLLKSHINPRNNIMVGSGEKIDWATAESLAMGSLLMQGYNVRLSGQDVGRGTFSQRHAMLTDQETYDIYIPLNHLLDNQKGKLEIANSSLSEEAVLGFEYGMSIDQPNNLIIWEAQFGDFFNGAQIIIDTFITSGETKWMRCSGLVLLLPHGYDGAGSEHSSSRIERFLQLTDSKETKADGDNVNFEVVNPTTPAQYFHLLRRQMIRNFRKPLVVISPKILLRLSEATSSLSEFQQGTHFQRVILDKEVNPEKVKKLIFTSGKHYYALRKEQLSLKINDIGIVRLESLCPFPTYELQQTLLTYKNATDFIWSQEEPRNMGSWTFVKSRFENLVGIYLRYVGSDELGTPAMIGQKHLTTQKKILADIFR